MPATGPAGDYPVPASVTTLAELAGVPVSVPGLGVFVSGAGSGGQVWISQLTLPVGVLPNPNGSTGVIAAQNVGGFWVSLALLLSSTGAGSFELIFRPGEPNPQGNVFSSWPALVAAAALIADPKTVIFDDRLSSITLPVGAWDLGRGCTFRALLTAFNSAQLFSGGYIVNVFCPDGVTFTTPIYIVRDVQLVYQGTGVLMPVPNLAVSGGNSWTIYVQGSGRLNATAAGGRLFEVPSNGRFVLVLQDAALGAVSNGGLLWNVLAGAVSAQIRSDVESASQQTGNFSPRVPQNSLAGVAGPAYSFFADSPNVIASAQAGMPGGIITPVVESPSIQFVSWTDANQTITFSQTSNVPGDGGVTIYDINPTSQRTANFTNTPVVKGTTIKIANNGAVDLRLTFAAGGLTTPAQQSYVQGLGSIELVWNGATWDVMSPQVQRGSAALVNGISAFIPADIVGGDVITTGDLLVNGAAGDKLQQFGFVNGTKATTGGFQLRSVNSSTGLVVNTDQGTYLWHLIH